MDFNCRELISRIHGSQQNESAGPSTWNTEDYDQGFPLSNELDADRCELPSAPLTSRCCAKNSPPDPAFHLIWIRLVVEWGQTRTTGSDV
jgi:hypothetical protein